MARQLHGEHAPHGAAADNQYRDFAGSSHPVLPGAVRAADTLQSIAATEAQATSRDEPAQSHAFIEWAPVMNASPGSRLDHYEIIESIGKGGMGEVYRARRAARRRDQSVGAEIQRTVCARSTDRRAAESPEHQHALRRQIGRAHV